MSFLTPDSPLGLAVQKMLLDARDGLAFHDIRRRLRLSGKTIEEHNLRELLAHPLTFTALSGDRYCLAGQVSNAVPQPPAKPPAPITPVFLASLPHATADYIVIDLETTGLDPSRDAIVQCVAIWVRNGRPVDARNYYLNPAPATIPYTLRLTLGLDRYPHIDDAIRHGRTLADIAPDLRAFLGDLPLVAHNARFEQSFLTQALGALPNRFVDTFEMALALYPAFPKHKLEHIAGALGVGFDAAEDVWAATGAESPVPIGKDTLHNAITDTALLAAVYRRMLADWHTSTDTLYEWRRALLPETYGDEWDSNAPDVRPFLQTHIPPIQTWGDVPAILTPPAGEAEVYAVLERYRHQKNYGVREGQARMVGLVWQALVDEEFALIEAPTGTGKTVAALIPALVAAMADGSRIGISTAYRNLQDQVLAEIADIQGLLDLPFRFQIVKGAANYLCHDRLAQAVAELDATTPLDERYCLFYLLAWTLRRTHAGTVPTLDDVNFWLRQTFAVMAHVVAAVSAVSPSCHPRRCCDVNCALLRVTESAKSAHLLLINHDLWLADPDRLPDMRGIIVDEAHTLEDVATRASTKTVSGESLTALYDRLRDNVTGKGALPRLLAQTKDTAIGGLVQQLLAALGRCRPLTRDFGAHLVAFVQSCQMHLDPRYGAAYRLRGDPRKVETLRWAKAEAARTQLFSLHVTDVRRTLERLIAVVEATPDLPFGTNTSAELRAILDGFADQLQLQHDIVNAPNTATVYWIDVATDPDTQKASAWSLNCAPIRVGGVLQQCYESVNSAIFVSATLAIRNGDFSFFIDRFGLDDYLKPGSVHIVTGDLDYSANAFLGLVNYLDYAPVERTMRSFKEELGAELKLLLDFTGGRALGLFTARERMEDVYERIVPYLAAQGIPVYKQGESGSRRQLQEEFQTRIESVLLGLQSFWEGIDVPGEALSFVIMEKLPFPYLFDPIFKARQEDVAQRKGHEFHDYVFPLMAIRFKQGFGRLLRRSSDRGAVILLDKRIHRKEYMFDLLGSLPGYMPRDPQAERSRRLFYQALIDRLPGLIDASKHDLLATLPDAFIPDLVARLAEYRVPQTIADTDFDLWRPTLLAALMLLFKYADFRNQQEAVIRAMLTGHDVLALLPTGAGKSLCFQLTALLRDGVTLVFSPLIALMQDQVRSLNERGIEIVGAIRSGQSADEREDILARMRSGKIKLVYISPERIRDTSLINALRHTHIAQIVVDEAHCVALWGPSFRPDFLYLPRLFRDMPQRPPIAAFTATATPAIRDAIVSALDMHEPQYIIAGFDRPELRFVVYNTTSPYNPIRSKNDRFAVLMKIVQAADTTRDSVIVYVTTVAEAEFVARRLRLAGHDARHYHGRIETAERESVQEMFMDDQINIVVCTKAFGMGIDKRHVRYVVHYQMPGDLESYYQEAGRAGRDGEVAYCVLLYHKRDRSTHDFFIESGQPDTALLNRLAARLRAEATDTIYLDTRSLVDEFETDEVGLKIGLHLLEQAGFIERGSDFTLHGALTLLVERTEIAAHLAADPDAADLFARVAVALELPDHRRIEFDMLPLAASIGSDPATIDRLLAGLAVVNLAIYRPWEKGNIIHARPPLVRGESYAGDTQNAPSATLTTKLETMIAYATNNTRCRRATILRYFGQDVPSANCGRCDVCQPEYAYPWSGLTGRDVARFSDYFDPAFTLLEVIKWNLDQRRKDRSAYGIGTLINVLRGNAYTLGKHTTDPHLRKWRLNLLRGCPYWGIFDGLPNADKIIERTLARLRQEGYIADENRNFTATDGARDYAYPILLPKGRDQLARGEKLNWESDNDQ